MTRSILKTENLLTLLDGPYPTLSSKGVLQPDRLILIGGGIGITGLLPFLDCHSVVRLMYSVKAVDKGLVQTLSPVLDDLPDKEIAIGQRLSLDAALRDEAQMGWGKIGVVVCGPTGMCDGVRALVASLGREKCGKCTFELEVVAFS